MFKSIYPRQCEMCGSSYKYKGTFYRHKKLGTCNKRQNGTGGVHITHNHIHNGGTTNYNSESTITKRELEEKCEQQRLEIERLKRLNNLNTLPFASRDCIYILRTRHAIDCKFPVYKVGYSNDVKARLSGYPKGSQLLYVFSVENGRETERGLHSALATDSAFKKRIDFGSEYYEGDILALQDFTHNFIKSNPQ